MTKTSDPADASCQENPVRNKSHPSSSIEIRKSPVVDKPQSNFLVVLYYNTSHFSALLANFLNVWGPAREFWGLVSPAAVLSQFSRC